MEASGLAGGVGAESEQVGALFGVPGHQQFFGAGFLVDGGGEVGLIAGNFLFNGNPHRQASAAQRHILRFIHRQTDPLELAGRFEIEIRFLVQMHFLVRLDLRNQRSQINLFVDLFRLLFGRGICFLVFLAGLIRRSIIGLTRCLLRLPVVLFTGIGLRIIPRRFFRRFFLILRLGIILL